jgi:hypothetical protein
MVGWDANALEAKIKKYVKASPIIEANNGLVAELTPADKSS